MPAKTKRAAAPKTVKIYNHTTQIIGCFVPASIKGHPPRHIGLAPGNNDEVPAEDWDLMQRNETFMRNFQPQNQLGRTGKTIVRTNLELGKTDTNQAEEEAELDRRIEKAREERAATGSDG